MKIRYSEIFASFQGEAEFAGTPCIWIRLFGCNLNCSGFGQKDPLDPTTWVLPYETVDISHIKDVNHLPVFEYGCDSSYSWSNRYKHLAKDADASAVVDEFEKLLRDAYGIDDGSWNHPVTKQPVMLCFTGGEPMMWQKAIKAIWDELKSRNHLPELVTIETNGTKPFNELLMGDIARDSHLHFAVSPKLESVSGEAGVFDVHNLMTYHGWAKTGLLKIVHNGSKAAWEELDEYTEEARKLLPRWPFWIMPVGATKEEQELPSVAETALEAMKRGFKVATRNHCYVFGNEIGR